jgi:hypothetical protein
VDIATRDDAGKEKLGLVISLVDANNRSFIGRCILPCEDIIPGEQYNVALVLDGQAKYVYIADGSFNLKRKHFGVWLELPEINRIFVAV